MHKQCNLHVGALLQWRLSCACLQSPVAKSPVQACRLLAQGVAL